MITDRNKYTMPKGNMRAKPGENWPDCSDCGRIVGNGRFRGKAIPATAGAPTRQALPLRYMMALVASIGIAFSYSLLIGPR